MPSGRRPGPPQPPPDPLILESTGGVSPAAALLARSIGVLRFERGLTYQQLADGSGLNRSVVAGIEAGTRDPAFSSLVKLKTYFGLESWDDLLG